MIFHRENSRDEQTEDRDRPGDCGLATGGIRFAVSALKSTYIDELRIGILIVKPLGIAVWKRTPFVRIVRALFHEHDCCMLAERLSHEGRFCFVADMLRRVVDGNSSGFAGALLNAR